MLVEDAWIAARIDDTGELVNLEDQDRSQWDQAEISEGHALLEAALRREHAGPYQIQAAIAACHADAATASDTDWAQIAPLHGPLPELSPSPRVHPTSPLAPPIPHPPT